jgi:putative restriction endonuclease
MISQPVFFGPDDWISDHVDWHPRIQGGKTVEILHGDGQRILAECLERTACARAGAQSLVDDVRRYGAPRTVPLRLGQGAFRIAVTGAYGACVVSGEHSLSALEAAHVRAYAQGGEHALANGLLLRVDIHRLYDAGYVTVTPDYRFRVSGDLIDDFHNGREYERYAGRPILLPRAAVDRPSPDRLEWHAAEVFRG